MAKTVVPPKSVGELFEDLSDLKLKIALLAEEEDTLVRCDQKIKDDAQLEQLAVQGEQRMLKHINKSYRMNQIKCITRNAIPQVIRVAASILLFCYLGLTVAIAADSSVRIMIMEFIMNIEEEYTEFGFKESGEYIDIPFEWEGYYYPTHIPDGFTVSHIAPMNVTYMSNTGKLLEFDDMADGTRGTIDTENASIEFITINGHNAMLVQKEQWVSILWSVDNRILLIGYTGETNEAIRIAESVRMIR